MYKKSFALWYYTLLLIASSSMLWPGSMSDDKEKNYSTVQYQLGANTMRNYDNEEDLMRYNLHESSTEDSDVMQYAYRINFTSNNRENDDLIQYKFQTYGEKKPENDSQTSVQSRINSTDACRKKNFMSRKIHENALEIHGNLKGIKGENGSTSYDSFKNFDRYNPDKRCGNITCIRLYCPFSNRLDNQDASLFLETMYGYFNDLLQNENKSVDNLFLLVVHDPCHKIGQPFFVSFSDKMFFVNGFLYIHWYDTIIDSTSYCLAKASYRFNVNICSKIMKKIINNISVPVPIKIHNIVYNICGFLETLLSLVMFIVYSIVPELRNIHGFILCGYSGSKVITNTIVLVKIFIPEDFIEDIRITYAFVTYYFHMTSWFWLTVMSIDIWRTFRKLRSLQRNAKEMKQQERKKLIQYSAYGWGGPFMLVIIRAIIEFVPDVPEKFRPTFGNDECWLSDNAYLFYVEQMGVATICIIITITLCICTARKIAHYEKEIAHYLNDSESRCYKDNKQWFGLYLETIIVLFIVICLRHFMYVTQLFYEVWPFFLRYIYAALDVIEQFCLFIIFVWKKKIRQLLLKQFGCQNRSLFSASQHDIASSNSNMSETTSL